MLPLASPPMGHPGTSPINFQLVIGVGAQSTLWGSGALHFCRKNMYEKLTICPNFTWFLPENYQNIRIFMIFARIINKIPQFYAIFARKMLEFYIKIARKFFSPYLGATCLLCPPSPTPMQLVNFRGSLPSQTLATHAVSCPVEHVLVLRFCRLSLDCSCAL